MIKSRVEQQLIDDEGNGAIWEQGKKLGWNKLFKVLIIQCGKPFLIHIETTRFDLSLAGYILWDKWHKPQVG